MKYLIKKCIENDIYCDKIAEELSNNPNLRMLIQIDELPSSTSESLISLLQFVSTWHDTKVI